MKSLVTLTLIAFAGLVCYPSKLHSQNPNDSVKVILKLKSVNNVLTFNQPHVLPNTLEYKWEIKINTDNNSLTGDQQGYDVGIAMLNVKFGTSQSYTGSIISGSEQNTFIYQGNTVSYGNQLNAFFIEVDTSILICGLKAWPEFAQLDNNDTFTCATFINESSGCETDVTSAATIGTGITDQVNDVTYSFMDIKSVNFVSEFTVGLSESKISDKSFNFFPNPGNGLFHFNDKLSGKMTLVNASGIEVPFKITNNTIDLTESESGIYFLKIQSQNSVSFHKLIKN